MIRVYLSVKSDVNSIIDSIDSLDVISSSFHYDENSDNVLFIVEGNQSDIVAGYMLPPNLLTTEISTLSQETITEVTTELQNRNIITTGSVTVEDLLDNILKTFNSAYKSLGEITQRDFS